MDKFNSTYNKIKSLLEEARDHNYISGRRVTAETSYATAIDMTGNEVTYTDYSGKTRSVMMGTTDFGRARVDGTEEFIKGERGGSTVKQGTRWGIWLPDFYDYGKGVFIDGLRYMDVQKDPEGHPEEVKKLQTLGVPLTINCG